MLKWLEKNGLSVLVMLAFLTLGNAKPGYAVAVKWDINPAYRNDMFRWNIAGDITGQHPNVLSELTWNGIESWPLTANLQIDLLPCLGFYFRGDWAMVWNGRVQDSDYNGDNRTQEFSRSNNQTCGDNLSDWAGAVFLQAVRTKEWTVGGRLGYSGEYQNLRIGNGFQTIPATGPFPGLNSTYQAAWRGPWIGVTSSYQPVGPVILTGNIEYHWSDYAGQGDWNLREGLAHPVSFIHQANGSGFILDVGLALALADHWRIRLNLQNSDWQAGPGIDYSLQNDGSVIFTRFNEAQWHNLITTVWIEWH